MASSLCRIGSSVLRRAIFQTSLRASSSKASNDRLAETTKAVTEQEQKKQQDFQKKYGTIGDMDEKLTGHEKFEHISHLHGITDPFDMEVQPMEEKEGTLEDPVLIPSYEPDRLVGCLCDEDAIGIKWMTLYEGEPRRCECGKWFKLEVILKDQEWPGEVAHH